MFQRLTFYSLLVINSVSVGYCDYFITENVKIKQGVVSGKVEETYWKNKSYVSFKGLPFAEPPINNLRFLPPISHKGWDGIFNAYEDTPTCLQLNSRMRNKEPHGISGSEDCLHIDIFTPDLQGNYPVVVFDYNDNFMTGFNGSRTYSPDFFIEEDVIVVTVKNRLGLFGYLSSKDEVMPANNGIRDFILGLQWIQENIDQFGGDPKRVTLMGSRGGAALVNILLYSQQAKDLFNAVIMQSGTAFEPIYFPSDPRTKAFQLGAEFNIKTEDSETLLKELQKIDSEQLVLKQVMLFDDDERKKSQINALTLSPCVEKYSDDAILTTLPEYATIVNDVPILMGLNSREGLDLASHFIAQPRIFNQIAHDISIHFPIRSGFRFDYNSSVYKEANREIHNFYYGEYVVVDAHKILDYAVYIGDALRNYAVDMTAKNLATSLESPVYYYMFDFKGSLNENFVNMLQSSVFTLENWGATVTDELCYLHVCSRIKRNYEELKRLVSEQPEIKVLKKMIRMWSNFAKTGNPNPASTDDILKDFVWEPIDKQNVHKTNYLHINKKLQMKFNPLGKRAQFWDNFLAKYRQLAVDGVVKDSDSERDEL